MISPGAGVDLGSGRSGSLDDLARRLADCRLSAGNPSYSEIARRIAELRRGRGTPRSESEVGRTTVYDCFRQGRARVNVDLVVDIVQVLGGRLEELGAWRRAAAAAMRRAGAAQVVLVRTELPTGSVPFVGRRQQLAALIAAPPAAATLVHGMAGVGKTQLVLAAARQIQRRCRLPSLYTVLRGFDPQGLPPAAPAAVLDGVLRQLGVARAAIPTDLVDRARLVRDRLAAGPPLVVLDDVADAGQLETLLEAFADCRVLMTGRRRIEVDGLDQLCLNGFDESEGQELAVAIVGVRAERSPEASRAMARLVGHHPFALGLLAEWVAARPGWGLAEACQVAGDRISHGRLESVLDASLALSFSGLDADAHRLLIVMSIHPGPEFGVPLTAAIDDVDEPVAVRLLQSLTEQHLAIDLGDGRYRLHDLVRAHALAWTEEHLRPTDRNLARDRMGVWYLAQAASAVQTLHPLVRPAWDWLGIPKPDPIPMTTAQATRWFDRELPALLTLAFDQDQPPRFVVGVAHLLAEALIYRGDLGTARDLQQRAWDVVQDHGHQRSRASVSYGLGLVWLRLAQFDHARFHLDQALAIFDAGGHEIGAAQCERALGIVAAQQADVPAAAAWFRRGLARCLRIGDPGLIRAARGNLALMALRTGRGDDAVTYFEKEAERCRGEPNPAGEIIALFNAAIARLTLRDFEVAAAHAENCAGQASATGDVASEAHALAVLGHARAASGQATVGLATAEAGLALARRNGDLVLQSSIMISLACCQAYAGDLDAARGTFHEIEGSPTGVARRVRTDALLGLAVLACAIGSPAGAIAQWERALGALEDIGDPRAPDARAHLTSVMAGCGCGRDRGLLAERRLVTA